MAKSRFTPILLVVAVALAGQPVVAQQYPVVDNVTGDPTTILPQ